MANYLVAKCNTVTKSYELKTAEPSSKPYLRVSNSYLPLSSGNTTTGLQVKVNSNNYGIQDAYTVTTSKTLNTTLYFNQSTTTGKYIPTIYFTHSICYSSITCYNFSYTDKYTYTNIMNKTFTYSSSYGGYINANEFFSTTHLSSASYTISYNSSNNTQAIYPNCNNINFNYVASTNNYIQWYSYFVETNLPVSSILSFNNDTYIPGREATYYFTNSSKYFSFKYYTIEGNTSNLEDMKLYPAENRSYVRANYSITRTSSSFNRGVITKTSIRAEYSETYSHRITYDSYIQWGGIATMSTIMNKYYNGYIWFYTYANSTTGQVAARCSYIITGTVTSTASTV